VCGVAGFLAGRGLADGARVGILVENSPEYIAAYYGVLAAGGVVVPLNTADKTRGLVNALGHSEASWLFADGRHSELSTVASKMGGRMDFVTIGPCRTPLHGPVHKYEEVIGAGGSQPDISRIDDPSRLATLIYTSGTTGDPKGVMLSHGNMAGNVESIVEYLGLTADDSIVNVLPFFYSYGNSVLHTHLAVGGRLVLENSMLYPQRVVERIANERVTGFSGVPSTFALLLDRANLVDHDLGSLRYMTQAGGPMPPANVKRMTEALPHVTFFVMYGQTEATARLTYLPPDRLAEKPGSCGIPIPGVEVEVTGRDGDTVDPGETGEIRARGKNVMLGYWRNPDHTGRVLKDGWLMTGDLAHRDEEGFFYIDGRSSDMIKSGAHRISPQEVEEVIAEMEGVVEVAVAGAPDEVLGQVVKAVVVKRRGARIKALEIQKHCLENLAQHKVPRQVEFVTDLPKTPSGKVRRHAL